MFLCSERRVSDETLPINRPKRRVRVRRHSVTRKSVGGLRSDLGPKATRFLSKVWLFYAKKV